MDRRLGAAEPPGREDPTNVGTLVDLLFIAKNEDGEIERLVVGYDPVREDTEGHTKVSGLAIDLPHRRRPGADSIRVHPDSMTAPSRITSRAALPRFTHAA